MARRHGSRLDLLPDDLKQLLVCFLAVAVRAVVHETRLLPVRHEDAEAGKKVLCSEAASVGSLRLLQWAREHGCPWDSGLFALATGNVQILNWAFDNACPMPTGRMLQEVACFAARKGQLDALKWFHQRGCQFEPMTCAVAAWGSHLAVLRWLRANGCTWDEETCRFSARGGSLEVLKWARENGCPWNVTTLMAAARFGSLEVLRWAWEQGCPVEAPPNMSPSVLFDMAAANGCLVILGFLQEKGCPWSESTCAEAAEQGQVEALKWLRANGCPWDARTCASAALGGHLELLKWARANGCPWDCETCAAAEESPSSKGLIIDWIHDNGSPCLHNRKKRKGNAGDSRLKDDDAYSTE